MNLFKLPALLEGYSFTPGNNLREQQSEGGMPRQVVKYVGAVHSVNVTVALKNRRFQQYFWAFWRLHQGQNWRWQLPLDRGDLEECECRFISSSLPTETNRSAGFIKMSFTVLVMPVHRSADFDREIIRAWENGMINRKDDLEKIPNVWMPAATGV